MKKRILSAMLCVVLFAAMAGQALAIESPSIYVNGVALELHRAPVVVNKTTYVPYHSVVQAMYPDAVSTLQGSEMVLTATGLTLEINPANRYLIANGRYLYFSGGVMVQDGDIMVPVRTLAQAMGATVSWDSGAVYLQASTGPITPGNQHYNENDLYWLSHIIFAESGNQPLEGMIAVGNVVLNRVEDPTFPDSVRAVVFQRNQFTPVQNGTIYLTPTPAAIMAAKLCMDGANTADDSMYFINYRYSCWASRNRPYVATIGDHAFYA